jgi:hypothetical protein
MTACRLCLGDPDRLIVARWEMLVPLPARSQNRIGNSGGRRFQYAKIRDDFELAVLALSRALRIPRATKCRRVTFTRLYAKGGQLFDRGNLIGGLKPLLDALVRRDLLIDDSEKWVEDYYAQQLSDDPRRVGVLVVLEEFT